MKIAFAFTDHPNEQTDQILDVLGTLGLRATFFVNGARAMRQRESIQRAVREGHSVQSQGYQDLDYTALEDRHIKADLRRASLAINGLGAPTPWVFYNEHVNEALLRVVSRERLEYVPLPAPTPVSAFEQSINAVIQKVAYDGILRMPSPMDLSNTEPFLSFVEAFRERGYELGTLRQARTYNPALGGFVEVV